ncbi:MAG: hypothetical protein ACYTGH_12140, partial [Planctomycetota bacterium]
MIFFTDETELKEIRTRTQSGPGKALLDEILNRCEAHCTPGHDNELVTDRGRAALFQEGLWASPAAARLLNLTTAAAITGEARWAEKAAAAMAVIAGDGEAAQGYRFTFSGGYDVREPIDIACLDGYLPLALDWLGDRIPDDIQSSLRAFLREQVVAFRSQVIEKENLSWFSLSCNKFWHQGVVYIWALAGVYDPDNAWDRDAIAEAVDMLRTALHRGVDEAGAIGEGPNYGGHDAWRWASCAEILRRLGVVDLWVEEPKLTAMLEHPVDLLLPGGQGMENRADGNADSRTGLWPIALQARRSEDPQVQYAWEALGGRRGISADSVGENALEPLPFHL